MLTSSLKKLLFVLAAAASLRLEAAPPAVIPAPQLPIATPGFNFKSTANFDDLRHNVLNLIGTGRKRIWLLTDYLTDGEVASALYLAKYRNLDVKVYLGRDLMSVSGSRLPYLRAQSVPTYLRPRSGFTTPTLLFIDQRLYGITRDMNSLQRLGSAEIVQASPADVKSFVSWLKDAMEAPEIAYPKAFKSGRTPKEPFQGDSEGSYNYDRRSNWRKAPEGVIRELPKVPKWKQTEELRKRGIVPVPETPVPVATPDSGSDSLPKPPDTVAPTPQTEAIPREPSAPGPGAAMGPTSPPARAWDYSAPSAPSSSAPLQAPLTPALP